MTMKSIHHPRTRRSSVLATTALVTAGLALSACGNGEDAAADQSATKVAEPLAVTYDGGIYVLDGESLEVIEDIPLEGFNRLNPVGDDQHLLVSTSTGFRVLDAKAATLSEDEFAAVEPGHVVNHAGKTVLFSDGTGEITIFDPDDLGDGLPEVETHTSEAPHHGVAVQLDNGELVVTIGDAETRPGAQVRDAKGEEIVRSEECPGVHGEATAANETVALGCEDGLLIYQDGEFTKIDSPDEYGRIGNQAGHEDSPFVLGDYKSDPDAELERPEHVSITDTETGTLELLDVKTSYSFQSLARGPHGEGLVLGTDGAIHVIDLETAEVTDIFEVLDAWEEPIDWQETRPSIFVRGHTAYLSDPTNSKLHAVDVETGEVRAEVDLPQPANEISGVEAH